MKFNKHLLSTLTVAVVAISGVLFLASIPKSKARGYNRVVLRPCSTPRCISNTNRGISEHEGGWNHAPRRRRGNIFDQFNEMLSIPIRFNSVLQEEYQRRLSEMNNEKVDRHVSSPPYEINEDESKMELSLDVPGIDVSDIELRLVHGEKALKIKGSRSHKHNNMVTRSEFEQIFTIDPKAVDIDKLKASLNNGVLVVSVPKLEKPKVEEEQRIIPVEVVTGGTVGAKGGGNLGDHGVPIEQAEVKRDDAVEERDDIVVDVDLEITEEEDI